MHALNIVYIYINIYLSLNPLAFGLSYNLGRREREKLEGWKKKGRKCFFNTSLA